MEMEKDEEMDGRAADAAYMKLATIAAWTNTQTASLCEDHEGPLQFHHPRSRVIARLLLSICVIALLIVLLIVRPQPGFRSVRYWNRKYPLHRFAPLLKSSSPTGYGGIHTPTSLSTVCPCANTAISWASYTTFFSISLPAGHQMPVRNSTITDAYDFCIHQIVNLQMKKWNITAIGCQKMISAAVNPKDPQTFLRYSTLMDPLLLKQTVTTNIQLSLDRELNSCVSLMSNWDWNASFVAFDWLKDVHSLWQVMLQQFDEDLQSTDFEFWKAANKSFTSSGMPVLQVINNRTAIGMHIDWNKYLDLCDPLYCDAVEENSWIYRLFGALAQIGGFGALVLAAFRKVLWPALRVVCGWPSQKLQ